VSKKNATAADIAPPQIELRDVDTLIPYAMNARTHSDEQIGQIAASMVEFGWTNPVLLDATSGIIAGHGRVLGAQRVWEAGKVIPNVPTGKVPCIVLAHLSDAQRRALVLADNQLALNAGWDNERLKLELHALKEVDFKLEVIGFDPSQLSTIMYDGLTEVPIAAPGEEAASGVDSLLMRFGGTRVQMSEEELARLQKVHKGYADQAGVTFGFVAFLCDPHDGGGAAAPVEEGPLTDAA
jgi:ParB-like chromosome segregation protein Spo0J